MKRKTAMLLVVCTAVFSLTACGSSSTEESSSAEETIEYVDESEIAEVFTSPDDYKGKYITLIGEVFNDIGTDDGYVYYQAYYDIPNYDDSFVFYLSAEAETYSEDDYVKLEGKIMGSFEGENILGTEIECPMIEVVSIEEISYIDAVVPTITEVVPEDAAAEQYGVSLQIDKIEFAETETRIYLTETNNSDDTFDMFTYSMAVVQDGQQYDMDLSSETDYYADLEELSDDIYPGATSSGVVIFPALDSTIDFQLIAEGYSDNYDLDFDSFVIDVKLSE